MDTQENKYFIEGRHLMDLYREITSNSGLRPTKYDIVKIAKRSDLTQDYVRMCIDTFLFN